MIPVSLVNEFNLNSTLLLCKDFFSVVYPCNFNSNMDLVYEMTSEYLQLKKQIKKLESGAN